MDLSKLPKLSQTDAPPPADAPPPQQPLPVAPMSPGVGADVWFNTIVGLLVLYLGQAFINYLYCRMTGRTFDSGFTWPDGSDVPYFQVEGFKAISDGAVALFGIVVLIEAATKAWLGIAGRVPRAMAWFAVAVAVVGTVANLIVVGKLLAGGFGLGIISALAVAYGGYIIFDLLTIYRYRTA
jgi:hypothetical protein